MNKQPSSDNACYEFKLLSVPLCFNDTIRFLGFESSAYSDVTRIKYRLYHLNGLYWYSIIFKNGYVCNSLSFVSLSSCVRGFRSLCESIDFQLEDSVGLSSFVARYNRSKH